MALTGFAKQKEEDKQGKEVYFRLQSIFSKNKFGYHTRFMSDFDLFLDAALNERFIDESTLYYDDEIVAKEIEDTESGLANDLSEADIRGLLHD